MAKSAFLISYDNGESYEDHHVSPLCIVPTKVRAELRIAAWLAWAEKTRRALPAYPELTMSEDDYAKQYLVYQKALDAIKPPRGLDALRDLVIGGSLTFTKLPVLK
jgi:hypothetical protein